MATLLETLEDPWRFVVRFGLATGLRWSELCRAEARHLSRDGWLEVEHTTRDRVRRVPLGETDSVLAREIRQRVGKLVPFAPGSAGTFNRTVKRKAGLADFSAHRLRHTFATRWLARGGNIVALQQVLGHSELELTQRYATTTAEFVRAEAKRVAAAENGDETVTANRSRAQVVAIKGDTLAS